MSRPPNVREGFRFGPFVLSSESGELYQNESLCKRLRPQAHTILLELLRRPGEVVKRKELIALLWPDVSVPEGGLERVIGWLRQDLGDSKTDPHYIDVLAKVGVRFIAPVEKLQMASQRPTEIREADQMAVSEALPTDTIMRTPTLGGIGTAPKPDPTQLKIQSAEYREPIGDVWRAAELYEALASDPIVDRNSDLALEIERRAKKCRTVAAAIMRDGLSGTEHPNTTVL